MVIFFDIDGTIVDDGTQIIPRSTIESVEKLRALGHIPVVNTGRPYSHIDPRVRAMAFSHSRLPLGMPPATRSTPSGFTMGTRKIWQFCSKRVPGMP